MDTLILTRRDVAALLPMADCIAAVEGAFRLLGEGRAAPPGSVSVPARDGGFHVKAGVLELEGAFYAAKSNGNFPLNPARRALPTIQGVLVLCDAEDGRVLAVMDSVELTARRTAAATAVAARWLARPDSSVATLCGCGVQGRAQLRALARVLPLRRVFACDRAVETARDFADALSAELGLEVVATDRLAEAVEGSEVCVTCTTSREFLPLPERLPAGCFVAAVGVDGEHKREIPPGLLASSKVVVDLLEQCARIGDLRNALVAGVMEPSGVHAELGAIVAGAVPGRETAEEVIVFDSTGLGIQDVAAAAAVYRRALDGGHPGSALAVDLLA